MAKAENSRLEMKPPVRATLTIASPTPALGIIPTPIAADSLTVPPIIRFPTNPPTNFVVRPTTTTAMTNVSKVVRTPRSIRACIQPEG